MPRGRVDLPPMTDDGPLRWGRRFLLCPPVHFDVTYRINPWMGSGHAVDVDRAQAQWVALRAGLVAAGATVEELDPVPGLPDLVFTANGGLVDGGQVVLPHFRHAARRPEVAVDAAWFEGNGFEAAPLDDVGFEGAGDALPFRAGRDDVVLVAGHGPRTEQRAHAQLARRLGVPVVSVGLVDERLYHLDMTFSPLDDRRAIVVPDAWDREGRRSMAELVPEPLVLERDDAYRFTANAVTVGDVVFLPHCPPEVGRRLTAWGFEPVEVDVREFEKAGGAVRCLTLALDVALGNQAVA